MKPECRHVIEQIAALSTDELSPSEAELVRRHIEDCPPCKGEWVLFERTLFTLSSAVQPIATAHLSQQMWLVCLEHARHGGSQSDHASAALGVVSPGALPNLSPETSQLKVATPPKNSSLTLPELSDAQVVRQPFRDGFGWFLTPTRLGWAFAGSAAVALGAAYLFAPQPARDIANGPTMAMLPPMPANGPGEFVGFQPPPPLAAGLLDHHAALAFEPLSDNVNPSLVYSASYSSTQP